LQKKLLAIVIIVIIAVAAVAAWQFVPKTSGTREIRIGLVAPISGQPLGQDMERAAQLAVNEINAAGGIYVSSWGTNATIKLVNIDTVDDTPANAVTPVQREVESGDVDMLIGGYGSAGTLANEVVAIDNKVPYIITGASNALVTRRGPQANYGGLNSTDSQAITDADGMSYIFHYCTLTYDYGKTVVDFCNQVMKPIVAPDRDFRLAILYRNDAFGTGVDKATKYWITNESLPMTVIERAYDPTTSNYQTDLTAIADSHPDAVLVVDNPDKTPTIFKQGLNDVGLKTVYFAVENNQDPTFYSLLGSAGTNQMLEAKADPFQDPSYLPAIQAYTQKYNQTYGMMPGVNGAVTYDAFYIAKDAIERAGSVDKAAVRDALVSTNMPESLLITKSGRILFDSGVNYHEINAQTFMEQLTWDTSKNQLVAKIVWPATVSGISNFKQTDFVLPDGYVAGHP
jgi:branched-chain amino acid transport system substrate-binding protein